MKIFNPTAQQVTAFARRVIASLPDSLTEQKSELMVLAKLLPHHTDARKVVLEMLAALNHREQAQAEFCFPTAPQIKPHNGDGR